MKKTAFLLFLLFFLSAVKAQKVYFIYLQSEDYRPFYARMGNKVYNSSSSGYLILSKLRDSTYTLNIGFQGSQVADQPCSVTINKKDQGFLIKNFGERGWGLFNMQTLAVTMPFRPETVASAQVKMEKSQSNTFTDLLIKATDDTSLKEKPVVIKTEEKKPAEPDPVKEEVKQEKLDTPVNKPAEIVKETIPVENKPQEIKKEIKEDTVVVIKEKPGLGNGKPEPESKTENVDTVQTYKKSTVVRRSESSTTEGFGLVFLDIFPDGKTDTVKILIPNEQKKNPVSNTKQEEKRFLEVAPVDMTIKQDEKENKPEIPPAAVSGDLKKNNCPQAANDDDFFKLRRKMAAESREDNMLDEARKVFKTRCFEVKQIKNLSTLFLTDEGKYKFFDEAYSAVSDMQNFASLETELKNDYYLKRFKAMLQ